MPATIADTDVVVPDSPFGHREYPVVESGEVNGHEIRGEQAEALHDQTGRLRKEHNRLLEEHAKLLADYAQLQVEHAKLKQAPRFAARAARAELPAAELIGLSANFQAVLKRVSIVAPTGASVLIQGETGTGKEMVARVLHLSSLRRDRPMVSINCAAIPAGLLESELFGYERGAFTGAAARKVGRFELAHEGTLFLDEVADIPSELQPKLLRVLQERELERLGGTQTQRVDVRLVAATSRDLSGMVAQRQFRGDLYYRLNVFPVFLPPLRERSEDIPMLVRHFVKRYAHQMDKSVRNVAAADMEFLQEYPWPGNIRELQNFVERAVILSSGETLETPIHELEQIKSAPANSANAKPPASSLEGCEREHITRILEQTGWVVGGRKGAAALLGVKRTTLIGKIKKLGIVRNSPTPQASLAFS